MYVTVQMNSENIMSSKTSKEKRNKYWQDHTQKTFKAGKFLEAESRVKANKTEKGMADCYHSI